MMALRLTFYRIDHPDAGGRDTDRPGRQLRVHQFQRAARFQRRHVCRRNQQPRAGRRLQLWPGKSSTNFIRNTDGSFTTFTVDASFATLAYGINSSDQVVGTVAIEGASSPSGFLRFSGGDLFLLPPVVGIDPSAICSHQLTMVVQGSANDPLSKVRVG